MIFVVGFWKLVKPPYQAPIDKKTYDSVIALFEDNLRISTSVYAIFDRRVMACNRK